MNYHLKQLLGKYDPKLLRIRQDISWPAVNSMAQRGEFEEIKRYIKHKMAQQLAIQIPLCITETPTQDTLQLDAEVYVFEKPELLALLGACYNLGSDASRSLPTFS
jgi:hypothetical protein